MYKIKMIVCLLFVTAISFAQTKVGADKDKHGCKASAGYTYSIIKKDCIRIFDEPVQLKEVKPTKSSTSNTAIVFSKDNKMAEAFIPDEKTSLILKRIGTKGHYSWKNGSYVLEDKKGYRLKKSNKIIFSAN